MALRPDRSAPFALMAEMLFPPTEICAPGKLGVLSTAAVRDDAVTGARRTHDVRARTGVAGGGHHDHARTDRVRRRDGVGVVGTAEVGAERHVDYIHAVVDGPVDGRDDDIRRSGAAEDAHRVQVDLGCDTRPIVHSFDAVGAL